MKQIMENYGGTIIAIMVMGAILFLLGTYTYGNATLSQNAIGFLANESIESMAKKQNEGVAFLQYKKRKSPEISFIENYEIRTEEYVPVEACFKAENFEGERIPVEVISIIDIQERNLSVYEYNGKTCFYFELPGVYQVYVKATDEENQTSYAMVKVPVNKGGSV